MRRLAVLFLTLAAPILAANLKLYLKDGGYQLVREYTVEGDKLRYYSVERSDWEEMPVALAAAAVEMLFAAPALRTMSPR